ncbi:hypothetical protein IWW36_001585 [Coemansia brasiliensis]|uniref:DinB-like domain-containing protein n=1 Tax=Coemansia brasiliensis TaxID=2650707 RepID=A0A9W8M0Q7_9FUNG|nr:hypothetical protein IWW36_001585 [Coemansia brasiliensis]
MANSNTSDHLFSHAIDYMHHLDGIIGKLTDEQYTHESQALPGSTIGKHVRHVLDHFSLLYANIARTTAKSSDPQHPLGPVDYSHRERNPATESTVLGGQSSIKQMISTSKKIRKQVSETPTFITVVDIMPGGAQASFLSTVDRELWFCIHHMVHHNAIMASLMFELGLDPPTEFAYAPSTIKLAHDHDE